MYCVCIMGIYLLLAIVGFKGWLNNFVEITKETDDISRNEHHDLYSNMQRIQEKVCQMQVFCPNGMFAIHIEYSM